MKRSILNTILVLTVCLGLASCTNGEPANQQGAAAATYTNPIMAGDYADPTVLRVGEDYYMTHSSFDDVPGLQIWHSRNLVDWEPIGYALHQHVGNVWAPDMAAYEGKYYIYFPVWVYTDDEGGGRRTNFVVTAEKPEGPWSDPIELGCEHIDPGHIADQEGNRYLYFSDGHMMKLTRDGTAFDGPLEMVYDGWVCPDEWIIECRCLESPKLFFRDGFYYLISAEGGTAGPVTGHMVVVARSESPTGPWENSPINPIMRTESREQKWWSQGHGTIFEAADGTWWMMYHGYRNGYRNLGRHTLLVPIEWTEDGWPIVPEGTDSAGPLPMPAGEVVAGKLELSDDFAGLELGPQWRMLNPRDSFDNYAVGPDALRVQAKGELLGDSSIIGCLSEIGHYTIEVDVEIPDEGVAGLVLYYNRDHHLGITLQQGLIKTVRDNERQERVEFAGNTASLKILNRDHDIALYYKAADGDWMKCRYSFEISAMHNNNYYGFRSIRLALSAMGSGEVIFRNFIYTALE